MSSTSSTVDPAPLVSPFPPPRRVITYHDPSGECLAIDDTVPLAYRAPLPFGFAKMFVQSDFPGEPAKTVQYAEEQTQGFHHPQGVAASFLDFAPNPKGLTHYTDTFDYLVLITGTLTLETTEGKTYDIGAGDLVVNAGNIRAWHNRTDQWARAFAVLVPANEAKVDGQNLAQKYGTWNPAHRH